MQTAQFRRVAQGWRQPHCRSYTQRLKSPWWHHSWDPPRQPWSRDLPRVPPTPQLPLQRRPPSRGLAAAREGRIGWDSHLYHGEKLRCVIC